MSYHRAFERISGCSSIGVGNILMYVVVIFTDVLGVAQSLAGVVRPGKGKEEQKLMIIHSSNGNSEQPAISHLEQPNKAFGSG